MVIMSLPGWSALYCWWLSSVPHPYCVSMCTASGPKVRELHKTLPKTNTLTFNSLVFCWLGVLVASDCHFTVKWASAKELKQKNRDGGHGEEIWGVRVGD